MLSGGYPVASGVIKGPPLAVFNQYNTAASGGSGISSTQKLGQFCDHDTCRRATLKVYMTDNILIWYMWKFSMRAKSKMTKSQLGLPGHLIQKTGQNFCAQIMQENTYHKSITQKISLAQCHSLQLKSDFSNTADDDWVWRNFGLCK